MNRPASYGDINEECTLHLAEELSKRERTLHLAEELSKRDRLPREGVGDRARKGPVLPEPRRWDDEIDDLAAHKIRRAEKLIVPSKRPRPGG